MRAANTSSRECKYKTENCLVIRDLTPSSPRLQTETGINKGMKALASKHHYSSQSTEQKTNIFFASHQSMTEGGERETAGVGGGMGVGELTIH